MPCAFIIINTDAKNRNKTKNRPFEGRGLYYYFYYKKTGIRQNYGKRSTLFTTKNIFIAPLNITKCTPFLFKEKENCCNTKRLTCKIIFSMYGKVMFLCTINVQI